MHSWNKWDSIKPKQHTMKQESEAAGTTRPGVCAEWYANAKFGIFIHWGPASVPGWAARTDMNVQEMIREKGLTYYFANNPYAEWYRNTMGIQGSPTWQHQQETWGGMPYENFGPLFNEAAGAGNDYGYFADWAALFAKAGARYVVPVTKHHDGFTLWPSKVPPRDPQWSSGVDLIGKLREQVLAQNMKFGVYYSGLYDWTWNGTGIRNGFTAAINGYQSPEVLAYMDGHVKELIDLYQPSVIWNDIGYVTHGSFSGAGPAPFKTLDDLWQYYYNAVPDGNIDDRWFGIPVTGDKSYLFLCAISLYFTTPGSIPTTEVIDALLKQLTPDYDKPPGGLSFPTSRHDYRTYEYEVPAEIQPDKWELVRGIGLSFCYNQNEDPKYWLTYPQLVLMFVDTVSKNGNLLLNVGPMADGTLQAHEVQLLEDFGGWMDMYGAGIYDTTPWTVLAPGTYQDYPFSNPAVEDIQVYPVRPGYGLPLTATS
jgi:alpha-L-fucosidase